MPAINKKNQTHQGIRKPIRISFKIFKLYTRFYTFNAYIQFKGKTMLTFVHFKISYHGMCYLKVTCTFTYPTCNVNGDN